MCPLIPWNGVVYLENDYYCYASSTNIRGALWASFIVYICPLTCLLIIYTRITIFIRQQSNNQALAIKQRQDRDFRIIRRILVIVSILCVLGLPTMVLIAMFIITDKEYPLNRRIAFLPAGISMAGLSAALVFSIPQLNNIVKKLWQANRVAPQGHILPGSIQMGTIIGTT